MKRSVVALVLTCAATPGLARAQNCFRARPAPACESFWILEATSEARSGRLYGQALPRWVVIGSASLGGMVNLSPRWSLGAALTTVTRSEEVPGEDAAASHVGVVVRGRRWLGAGVSVDLTAGLWRVRGVKPTAEVALEVGGLLGLSVGVRGDGLWPRSSEVYAGVRYSSYLAAVAGFVALMSAVASMGGD